MPGAWRAKSPRVHRLSALWSLADASRVAWACASAVSSAITAWARCSARSKPASAQQAADVLLVSGSERLHARLGADVVLAVRQAQPALQQEGDVGLLAVDARFHRQAQRRGRSVDAPVQRVDIGSEPAAQEPGQRRLVPNVIDAVQQWLERRDAPGLDGGLVQIGGAEVRHLARGRSHRLGAGVIQQLRDLLSGELADLGPGVPAILACRDLGGLEPTAVGIGKEVVARPDARVHAGFEVRMRPVGRLRGCYSPGAPANTAANSRPPRDVTLDMRVTFEREGR